MTITDFLLARIAEDEAVAEAASPGGWHFGDVASVAGGSLYDETRMIAGVHYEQPEDHDGQIVRHLLSAEADANGRHIARHDPARVLAECAGKRQIVEEHRARDERAHYAYPPVWRCAVCCEGDQWEGRWAEDFPCPTLRALASVYADHPDYDAAWS